MKWIGNARENPVCFLTYDLSLARLVTSAPACLLLGVASDLMCFEFSTVLYTLL